MTLDEAISRLRELNEPVPTPMRLPTEAEVADAEARLSRRFHPEFRRYLLEASDVAVGALEPATIAPPAGHTDLVGMCTQAWDDMELPRKLLPICEDNGDYYCLNSKGQVVFWSHDGGSGEKWDSLPDWIQQVWLEEPA